MAWKLHYRCDFQSKDSYYYSVYIFEQDYDGDTVDLIAADAPFETQEDDDDDVFKPIRAQTGYLRVVDTDGTLLEQLMPVNNTEKMVQLVSWIEQKIKWQGFLQSQAFSQPWDGQKRVLEFPVKSFLGALEDTVMPNSIIGAKYSFLSIIDEAFKSLADGFFERLVVIDNTNDSLWLNLEVRLAAFFSQQDIVNESDVYTDVYGMNYYDILSAIASVFGVCFREDGQDLYIVMYDETPYFKKYSFGWLPSSISPSSLPKYITEMNILDVADFRSNDNENSFVQGCNVGEVTFDVAGYEFKMNFPQTAETSDTVDQIDVDNHHMLIYGQLHNKRTGINETFDYHVYNQQHYLNDNADDSECMQTSIFRRPSHIWFAQDTSYWRTQLYTGFLPLRWATKDPEQTQSVSLKSAIYATFFPRQLWIPQSQADLDVTYPRDIYTLQSDIEMEFTEGFINLDFKMLPIGFKDDGAIVGINSGNNLIKSCNIWMQVRIGDKYWDGTQWTATESEFKVAFESFPNIKTNKTSSMDIDVDDGIIMPITEPLSGMVSVRFYDHIEYSTVRNIADVHSAILYDLKVEQLVKDEIYVSSRGSNVYRKTIISKGFSNDKSVNLTIGTFNNNVHGVKYIYNGDVYLDIWHFETPDSTVFQRPEYHLLERIVKQYNQVRRTYTAVLHRGMEVMAMRYNYLGRKFFAVKSQVNWRDDTEKIKFIEVSQS